MSIEKLVDGEKVVFANKSVVDHSQLSGTQSYGCHPISAIRKLPEKLTQLKEKDTELQGSITTISNTINEKIDSTNKKIEELDTGIKQLDISQLKEDVNALRTNILNVEKNTSQINIIDNKDTTITFTDYNGNEKTIQSGALPDEESLTLKNNQISLKKVVTSGALSGDGTKDTPIQIVTDGTTITDDGTLKVIALDNNGEILTSSFISSELTNLNKDIGDLTDTVNNDKKELDDKNLEQDNLITALQTKINGHGGYLTAYNFKKNEPTQDELTNYAINELGVTNKKEVQDQTRVKNLYDNNVWILNNRAQDDGTEIYNWVNDGNGEISIATDTTLGIVKGSTEDYEGSVDATGHITINGLQEFIADTPRLSEENTYSGKNNFGVETDFNGVTEHNAEIHLNDNILQISNTTRDTVTKIDADKITIEKGTTGSTTQYEVNLPSKSGTIVVDADLTKALNTVDDNVNYYAGGATPTANDKYSIVIGSDATSNGTGNIIYGTKAYGPGDVTNTDGTISKTAGSIVIGDYAGCYSEAVNSIVIGTNARSEAENTIQLGTGTNNTANSVQFFGDNIYKKDTKTFTMANAEINGNSVYGVIKGESAPTGTTVGVVGQEYQDITNKKRYYCAYASDVNYVWKEIQTKLTQESTTMDSITGETTNVIRIGNLLIQSITYTNVAGNSEKTWTFPKTFDKLLIWDCNSTAEGESVNNGAAITSHSESSLTVRTCGATSDISLFAIGWQAE